MLSSVTKESLRSGGCYFFLGYFDKDNKFPSISTYVFIGTNLLSEETEVGRANLYFQNPVSFLEDGPFHFGSKIANDEMLVVREDALHTIYDLDELISRLKTG